MGRRKFPESPSPPEQSFFQSPPSKSLSFSSPPPHISPPPKTHYSCFSFRIKKSFEVLDVDPCSSKWKARIAYILLARIYYPDKGDINISEYTLKTRLGKFKIYQTLMMS